MLDRLSLRIDTGYDNRESFLDRLAVLCIYAGIYLKDIASAWGQPSWIPMMFLALGCICGIAAMLLHRSDGVPVNIASVLVLFIAGICWIFSSAIAGRPNASSYYMSIPCAFVIVNTAPRF